MNTKALLIETRRLIQQGHAKGSFAVGPGGDPLSCRNKDAVAYCVVGAANQALSVVPPLPAVRKACLLEAEALIRGAIPLSSGSLMDWNDAPERTQEEVLAVLDKAIERAP